MIDELMENKQYGDLKRGPRTGKGGEFGYQGPAVWQNTEEEEDIDEMYHWFACKFDATVMYAHCVYIYTYTFEGSLRIDIYDVLRIGIFDSVLGYCSIEYDKDTLKLNSKLKQK